MRRVLSVLVAAVALIGGGFALVRMLESDEARIRRLIADAAEAFDGGRPRAVVETLAPDWKDATSGLDRDALFRVLVAVAFQEKDPKTGAQLWSVVVPEEEVAVQVDGADATAALRADFFRGRDDVRELEWSAAIDLVLRDGEQGWKVAASSHRTREGARPGRR